MIYSISFMMNLGLLQPWTVLQGGVNLTPVLLEVQNQAVKDELALKYIIPFKIHHFSILYES